jgi:hypothetical protein
MSYLKVKRALASDKWEAKEAREVEVKIRECLS